MTPPVSDWKRMRFKKNKVWLAIDQNGKPLLKNGKVLIKYQLDQTHKYWVHQKNVTPIAATTSESIRNKDDEPANATASPEHQEGNLLYEKALPDGNNDIIKVYTDGASAGNPGPSGIGIVLKYGSHEKEISKYIGIATNNIAELAAIREGMKQLKQTDLPVRIFTDSSYAHGVLSLNWKAKKNKSIIQSIQKAMSAFKDIKIIKIKGHVGIEGNERADVLATSAIKTASSD
ncbi:MAG: ribonuclease HI [Desulfobacterales bacterium]|nr:MAG: ribonuclease HI [Desulfobacterales bacterium]